KVFGGLLGSFESCGDHSLGGMDIVRCFRQITYRDVVSRVKRGVHGTGTLLRVRGVLRQCGIRRLKGLYGGYAGGDDCILRHYCFYCLVIDRLCWDLDFRWRSNHNGRLFTRLFSTAGKYQCTHSYQRRVYAHVSFLKQWLKQYGSEVVNGIKTDPLIGSDCRGIEIIDVEGHHWGQG